MRSLNREWRGVSKDTDVLSMRFNEVRDLSILSPATSVSYEQRYIVHYCLFLCKVVRLPGSVRRGSLHRRGKAPGRPGSLTIIHHQAM